MPTPPSRPDRRDFLRSVGAGWATLVLGGTGALVQACAGLAHAPYRREGDTLLVDAEAVEPAGMVFLDDPAGGAPILLTALASGGHAAVLTRCPRDGCRLDPDDERLVCPCGASTFALTGRVLAGPAEEDLVSYPVTLRPDGTLVVAWSPGR